MSRVTLSIAQWALARSSRASAVVRGGSAGEAEEPPVLFGVEPPGSVRSATSRPSRQRRARKRKIPSTPSSDQSPPLIGGPMKQMYVRSESAPKRSTYSAGLTVLPRDLDIF